MNIVSRKRWISACGIGMFGLLCSSCVTPGEDNVAVSGAVSFGVDFYDPFYYSPFYYDPFYYNYRFWGPTYRIAPPQHGEPRYDPHRNPPPPHTYRPAPPSHPTPSIPSRPPPRQSPRAGPQP